MEQPNNLILPIQVTGRVDTGRILREVEQIDNFLKQSAIREPGSPVKMPKTSRLLDEFVANNKLNLLHEDDRSKALNFLIMVKAKAPVLHMSFSVDPAPSFVQKLMKWLREEVHPLVLLQVGLQPNIGAGTVVRGTNKYFDFSLREHFKNQRPLLIEKLHGDMQKSGSEHSTDVSQASVAPEAAATEAPDPVESAESEVQQQLAEQVETAIAALDPAKQAEAPQSTTTQPEQEVRHG